MRQPAATSRSRQRTNYQFHARSHHKFLLATTGNSLLKNTDFPFPDQLENRDRYQNDRNKIRYIKRTKEKIQKKLRRLEKRKKVQKNAKKTRFSPFTPISSGRAVGLTLFIVKKIQFRVEWRIATNFYHVGKTWKREVFGGSSVIFFSNNPNFDTFPVGR